MIEIEYQWLWLGILATGIASVHLWFNRFEVRFSRQEDRWMGFIGGVAMGYVTLYMLPKIARITSNIIGVDETVAVEFGDLRMYYLLLLATVLYLLMVHLDARETRWRLLSRLFDHTVHGAYSFLVGYVFIEMASARTELNALIALIFGLHLMGMDHILRTIRREGFDRTGRWIYFLLVLFGAGLGLMTELPTMFTYALTAFLAGIILVNVISEEFPLHYQARVPWFLGGVGFYLLASFFIITLDPPAA